MTIINTAQVLKGIVRGRTIELQEEVGIPDGAVVDVTVCERSRLPKELVEAFGVAAGSPESVEAFLRQTYQDRENDPRNGATL